MSLQSMTGFAREAGTHEGWHWAWEIRSVNGRGLELKFKLPPGFDGLSEQLRRLASTKLQRGSVFAALSARRDAELGAPAIDEVLLDQLIDTAKRAASRHGLETPRIEALLAIRGVVETGEAEESEAEREAVHAVVAEGFKLALEAISRSRIEEGARLEPVLAAQIASIERLTESAETCPARQPDAVRERLEKQLRELTGMAGFDAERLHQEAVLIASRADVREEIDRLRAHVAAARELLAKGGAVGRRLDFLAQEFGREANTLTAKANDPALSRIGLELKSVVEQWREQVQNVE